MLLPQSDKLKLINGRIWVWRNFSCFESDQLFSVECSKVWQTPSDRLCRNHCCLRSVGILTMPPPPPSPSHEPTLYLAELQIIIINSSTENAHNHHYRIEHARTQLVCRIQLASLSCLRPFGNVVNANQCSDGIHTQNARKYIVCCWWCIDNEATSRMQHPLSSVQCLSNWIFVFLWKNELINQWTCSDWPNGKWYEHSADVGHTKGFINRFLGSFPHYNLSSLSRARAHILSLLVSFPILCEIFLVLFCATTKWIRNFRALNLILVGLNRLPFFVRVQFK